MLKYKPEQCGETTSGQGHEEVYPVPGATVKFVLELKTGTGDTGCVECRIYAESEKSDNQATDEMFVSVGFLRNEIIFP